MKKILLFVSCVAMLFIVSSAVTYADSGSAAVQEEVLVPVSSSTHDQRDVRRTLRLDNRLVARDSRLVARQTRLDARYAEPQPLHMSLAGLDSDGAGPVAADDASVPTTIVQTGRRNSNTQRVTSNNMPVLNFLSLTRNQQPLVYRPR